MQFMDAYTMHARVLPSIATWFPAWAVAAATSWSSGIVEELGTELTLAIVGGGMTLWSAATAKQGARRGKRREPELWRRWGGKPTTRMLRRGDSTLSEGRKAKVREWMAKEGLRVPTEREERDAAEWADEQWDLAVTKMREITRGDARVDEKNRTYGYYRNLYGMKGVGWCVGVGAAAIAALMAWSTATNGNGGEGLNADTVACGVILAWIGYWSRACTEERVKDAAEEYAIEVIECTLGKV